MVSPIMPFGVRFRQPPPELSQDYDTLVTPGAVYDIQYTQIVRQRNGAQEVWVGITDDTGAVKMFPARLAEILDMREYW